MSFNRNDKEGAAMNPNGVSAGSAEQKQMSGTNGCCISNYGQRKQRHPDGWKGIVLSQRFL